MNKYTVTVNGRELSVELIGRSHDNISFRVNQQIYDVKLQPQLDRNLTNPSVMTAPAHRSANPRINGNGASADAGVICAPMPGLIVNVMVKKNQKVKAGETLLSMEAMKMENAIKCPRDATISEILVKSGDEVQAQAALLKLAAE